MLFDKLAGMVERHSELHHLRKIMEMAHIFEFPGPAHELLPTRFEDADFLNENFFLPFASIAVEDPASVVLLYDLEPEAKGLKPPRLFVEASYPYKSTGYHDSDSDEVRRLSEYARRHFTSDTIQISIGLIYEIVMRNDNYNAQGDVFQTGLYSKAKVISTHSGLDIDERGARNILRNALTVIEEVIYFNTPSRYVLETTPIATRKSAKSRIPRSDSKSRYTLLTPDEIRSRLRLPPVGTHSSPSPHWRRRHYRTFRSDKYVNKKGQTIIIPKKWIGPTEHVDVKKNKRYKIRLDI